MDGNNPIYWRSQCPSRQEWLSSEWRKIKYLSKTKKKTKEFSLTWVNGWTLTVKVGMFLACHSSATLRVVERCSLELWNSTVEINLVDSLVESQRSQVHQQAVMFSWVISDATTLWLTESVPHEAAVVARFVDSVDLLSNKWLAIDALNERRETASNNSLGKCWT